MLNQQLSNHIFFQIFNIDLFILNDNDSSTSLFFNLLQIFIGINKLYSVLSPQLEMNICSVATEYLFESE